MNVRLGAYHYRDSDAPDDCPRLDFRFFRPDSEGRMVPTRIREIRFWPVASDKKSRIEAIRPWELRGFGFAYMRIGLFRLPLFSEVNPKKPHMGLKMGRTYYVQTYEDGWMSLDEQLNEGKTGRGSAFVTIPDNVPPGKLVVIDLDITSTDDRWRISEGMLRTTVTLRVPAYRGRPMQACYYDPETDRMRDSDTFRNGKFTWTPRSLKGELALFDGDRRYCVYYRKGLRKELRFPEDAQAVLGPKDLRRFTLRVPEPVPEETGGLCLLRKRGSPIPLAVGRLLADEDPDTMDLGGQDMEFHAPPGTHTVAYLKSNGGLRVERCGSVMVPESPQGKRLLIE